MGACKLISDFGDPEPPLDLFKLRLTPHRNNILVLAFPLHTGKGCIDNGCLCLFLGAILQLGSLGLSVSYCALCGICLLFSPLLQLLLLVN
jgi:hypothetical protein